MPLHFTVIRAATLDALTEQINELCHGNNDENVDAEYVFTPKDTGEENWSALISTYTPRRWRDPDDVVEEPEEPVQDVEDE